MARPILQEIAVDGSSLALRYSELLHSTLPSASRFQVLVNGIRRSVSGSAVLAVDGKTIRLNLTTPILSTDRVSISYISVNGLDKPGFGEIRSASGGENAAYFRNLAAPNLTSIPPTVTIVSDKTVFKTGETALITFSFSRNPGMSFSTGVVDVSGGSLSSLMGTGTTYTAIFIPTPGREGPGSITLPPGSWNDIFGNIDCSRERFHSRLIRVLAMLAISYTAVECFPMMMMVLARPFLPWRYMYDQRIPSLDQFKRDFYGYLNLLFERDDHMFTLRGTSV